MGILQMSARGIKEMVEDFFQTELLNHPISEEIDLEASDEEENNDPDSFMVVLENGQKFQVSVKEIK